MSNRIIILACTLLASLVAGMFIYTYLVHEEAVPTPPEVVDTADVVSTNRYGIDRIEAKYFYRDGVHTIVGELPMPTPCDLLETDALVAESMPEVITFNFTVINTTDTCAEVVTPQRFMVQATASPGASIRATFMGIPVTLNLVEALPGESPEDFELYTKG